MRRVLLFAHRWFGLTAGLIVAIAALTGGILVYQDELNDPLAGPGAEITPGHDLRYDNILNGKLHFAQLGGPIIRIWYAVSCLIGAGLFATGVVMWWKRGEPVIREAKVWERAPHAGSQ